MAKCQIVTDSEGRFYGIRFDCPGCALIAGHGTGMHVLPTDWQPAGMTRSPIEHGDSWAFNGDMDHPVFGPSILSRRNMHVPPVTPDNLAEYKANPWPQEVVSTICHSFIGCNGAAPGQIIFLCDCTHALKGQVIDLPELPGEA